MRKLLKSKKALSPVVAAIILVAVTVAVSIAVAVWMGSLTTGFMETKEAIITNVVFTEGGSPVAAISIDADVSNTGTTPVTVAIAKVNGVSQTFSGTADPVTIAAGAEDTVVIDYTTWVAGNKYKVTLFGSDGTLLASYEATA
jgi:flagellin-like protein